MSARVDNTEVLSKPDVRTLPSQGALLATAVVLLAITSYLIIALAFGGTAIYSIQYLLYNFAFVLFPGCVAYRCIFSGCRDCLKVALHGWFLGLALEMWCFLVFVAVGASEVFVLYPLWAVLLVALRLRRSRVRVVFGVRERTALRTSVATVWRALVIWAIGTFLLFSAALSRFTPFIDFHFLVTTATTNALLLGWPPIEPYAYGVPLHYHYLFNLHLAGAHVITDVPVHVLVCRLAPSLYFAVLLLLLLRSAYQWFGSVWVGVLAMIQIFLTYGKSEVMWQWFHSLTGYVIVQVPSHIIAFSWFLVCLDEARTFSTNPKYDWRSAMLLCLFLWTGIGLRAQLVPVLVAAFLMLGFVDLLRRRKAFWRMAGLSAVGCISIVFGMYFFFGFGSSVDATDALRLTPFSDTVANVGGLSPMYLLITDVVSSPTVSSVLFVVLALIGRLGFLAVGLAFFLVRRMREGGWSVPELLGCGAYVSGILALLFIASPDQQQWPFLWYGEVVAAMAGAQGLQTLVRSRRSVTKTLLLLLVGTAFLWQAVDFARGFLPDLADIADRGKPPHYSNYLEWADIVDWLEDNAQEGDVLVSSGTRAVDDRVIPAFVRDVQLYAHHGKQPAKWRSSSDATVIMRRDRLVGHVNPVKCLHRFDGMSIQTRDCFYCG